MSLDLVAFEIARAWGRDPWWLYDAARGDVENMLAWWRAVNCEAPKKRQAKLAAPVQATQGGRSFWLGG